jgi:hypothetical protein
MTDWAWSKEDDDKLRELFAGTPYSRLAQIFGRSRSAISGRVRRLGLVKSKHLVRTEGRKVVAPPKSNTARDRAVAYVRVPPRPPYYAPEDQVRVRSYAASEWQPITETMLKLIDLKEHHCRRPIDTCEGVLFCGKTIDQRYGSYCCDCGPHMKRPVPVRRV